VRARKLSELVILGVCEILVAVQDVPGISVKMYEKDSSSQQSESLFFDFANLEDSSVKNQGFSRFLVSTFYL
jgi:hypothetical protein